MVIVLLMKICIATGCHSSLDVKNFTTPLTEVNANRACYLMMRMKKAKLQEFEKVKEYRCTFHKPGLEA